METHRNFYATSPVVIANILNSSLGPLIVDTVFPDRTFKSDDPADDIQKIIDMLYVGSKCTMSFIDTVEWINVGADCSERQKYHVRHVCTHLHVRYLKKIA